MNSRLSEIMPILDLKFSRTESMMQAEDTSQKDEPPSTKYRGSTMMWNRLLEGGREPVKKKEGSTKWKTIFFINILMKFWKPQGSWALIRLPSWDFFAPVDCSWRGVPPTPVHQSPTIAVSVFYQAMRLLTQQLSNWFMRPAQADTLARRPQAGWIHWS